MEENCSAHVWNMVEFSEARQDFEEKIKRGQRFRMEEALWGISADMVNLTKGRTIFEKDRTPITKLVVFHDMIDYGARLLELRGYSGASWFNFEMGLFKFLPKGAQIIEVVLFHEKERMNIMFLPKVLFKERKQYHKKIVKMWNGKTIKKDNRYTPCVCNHRILGPKDYNYLF